MTPAELARANLLPKPATVLSTAAGVVYFLIFEEGIGPAATNDQITAWVEGNRQGTVLGIARNGDAVGVAFKAAGGGQKTVQTTFLPLDDAPAFGRANLAIRYAVQGTDPRKLPDYVSAGAATPEIDDGVGGIGRRIVQGLPNPSQTLAAAKWVAIAVLIGLALYAAIQLLGFLKLTRRAA